MAIAKSSSFGDMLDYLKQQTGLTEIQLAARMGAKDASYFSKLRGFERNGRKIPRVFKKKFEAEFEYELFKEVSRRAATVDLIKDLTEKIIRLQAWNEVLVEQVVHLKVLLNKESKTPTAMKRELEYLTKRQKEVAEQQTIEWKS